MGTKQKASHIWVNVFQDLPALVDIVNVEQIK